jgi:hypothetical protein
MTRSWIAIPLLAVFACVEEAPVAAFPEQALPATITASDRDLLPGETATLTVSVTNPFEEDVLLTFPTACQAVVFVRDSRGRVTTPASGRYVCVSVPSSLLLAPGETKTFTSVWGGGVEFGAAGTSERVPPGSYYVSAELRADQIHAIAFPITIVVH